MIILLQNIHLMLNMTKLERIHLIFVAGVTTPSGRVAHALGLWQWIEYKTL